MLVAAVSLFVGLMGDGVRPLVVSLVAGVGALLLLAIGVARSAPLAD